MKNNFEWTDALVIEMQRAWVNDYPYLGFAEAMEKFKNRVKILVFRDKYGSSFRRQDTPYQTWVDLNRRNGHTIYTVVNNQGVELSINDKTNRGTIFSFITMKKDSEILGNFIVSRTFFGTPYLEHYNINDLIPMKPQDESSPTYPKGILSFIKHGVLNYQNNLDYNVWIKDCLDKGYSIKSVKNSYEEIISVGMEVTYSVHNARTGKEINHKVTGIISCIHIELFPETLSVIINGRSGIPTADVRPVVAKPIITPPPHFRYGWVWLVNPDFTIVQVSIYEKNSNVFVTRQEAEQYVEDNKPMYSKRQIREAAIHPFTKAGEMTLTVCGRPCLPIDLSRLKL